MLGTLPEEIAREILYRLPINSLVKCVCVSKTWCSFIKSPGFVSGHLNKTIACNDAVGTHLLVSRLCIRDRNERQGLRENYSLRFDDESLTEYKQLDFPFNGKSLNSCFRVVASCNGLIFLAYDYMLKEYLFILWIPSIRKFSALPHPRVKYLSHGPYDAFVGFGFDSKNNDYKVLRYVQLGGGWEEVAVEVETYSLNANSWKSITDITPNGCTGIEQPQAFVHGAIHFLSYRQFAYFIMVFDLGDEYFHEMALPGSLIHPTMGLPSMTLKEFGDSSVAVIQLESNQLHLWIMKEYGVFESWTKLSSNTWIGISFLETELAFRRNEELLYEDKDGDILALNVTNTKWRKVFNTQCYEGRASFNSYVESLVLIDKGKSTMDISSWDF